MELNIANANDRTRTTYDISPLVPEATTQPQDDDRPVQRRECDLAGNSDVAVLLRVAEDAPELDLDFVERLLDGRFGEDERFDGGAYRC